MNKVYKYILLLILFSLSYALHAQEKPQQQTTEKENVIIKADVQDAAIRLRWAPVTAKAWIDGKKYGYVLEKYIAVSNGEILKDTVGCQVIPLSFLPAPLSLWETHANASDYAAVIAQSFYGDEFSLTSQNNDYGTIINQANELEQRFATSVFMAEYDYKAAELAGWGWTDTDVRKNEKYFYRLHINKPEPEKGDTAVVFVGLDNKKTLPKPIGLTAIWGDKSVMLSWNYAYQADFYHSFYLERALATDKVFKPATDLPLTPLGDDMTVMFHADSLADNNQKYIYRIRGITSFGDLGPYSDEIEGQGKETILCVPNITNGFFMTSDQATITWTLDCDRPERIEKIQVKQSSTVDGIYKTISDNINVSQKTVLLTLTDSRNYLKVYAYMKDGEERNSLPYMLQRVDSIPPAVPRGLSVAIDSVGVAHLKWDANIESDLRGYRVLRGMTETEEMSSIAPELLSHAEYADTLSLSLLNKKVYYAVAALDSYYNESEPSETVVVVKPDFHTPSDPVITGYKVDGNKATISWLTDSLNNQIRYALVRNNEGNRRNSRTVFEGDNTISEFTDELSASGTYTYNVVATGKNGKKSFSPQSIRLNIDINEVMGITGFTFYKNIPDKYIELSWAKHPQAALYRIYKGEDNKNVKLLTELEASQNRLVDEQVSPSVKYTYMIIFISQADGRSSKPSTITVNF